MINIMQIVHDLNFGGMQRVVVDLCRNLNPDKFNLSVCCLEELGPNAKEIENREIPVFLVKKKIGFDYTLPVRLRKLFLSQNVHIVHTHGINPFFYGTIAAKLSKDIKAIQTDHARGVFPVSKKEMLSERILSFWADIIIAVSEGIKDDLTKYVRINPNKIKVIYNGIDGSKFRVKINKKKKREELGIAEDYFVIGIGVRLSAQKGLHYLVEAAYILSKSFPKFKLIIIGDGELREELETLAKEKGIADKVIFTGYRNDIAELLQIIDIYSLPSLWEGHPLVLLEAMAAGKPIVASDIPGNRETVVHGKTGLLVPPQRSTELASALLKLLENNDLRLRMGHMGFRFFEDRFVTSRMVREYQVVFEETLS